MIKLRCSTHGELRPKQLLYHVPVSGFYEYSVNGFYEIADGIVVDTTYVNDLVEPVSGEQSHFHCAICKEIVGYGEDGVWPNNG